MEVRNTNPPKENKDFKDLMLKHLFGNQVEVNQKQIHAKIDVLSSFTTKLHIPIPQNAHKMPKQDPIIIADKFILACFLKFICLVSIVR